MNLTSSGSGLIMLQWSRVLSWACTSITYNLVYLPQLRSLTYTRHLTFWPTMVPTTVLVNQGNANGEPEDKIWKNNIGKLAPPLYHYVGTLCPPLFFSSLISFNIPRHDMSLLLFVLFFSLKYLNYSSNKQQIAILQPHFSL